MRSTFTYASGYKSRDAAQEAIDDLFCDGEIDRCDNPQIRTYSVTLLDTGGKAQRFAIMLDR